MYIHKCTWAYCKHMHEVYRVHHRGDLYLANKLLLINVIPNLHFNSRYFCKWSEFCTRHFGCVSKGKWSSLPFWLQTAPYVCRHTKTAINVVVTKLARCRNKCCMANPASLAEWVLNRKTNQPTKFCNFCVSFIMLWESNTLFFLFCYRKWKSSFKPESTIFFR